MQDLVLRAGDLDLLLHLADDLGDNLARRAAVADHDDPFSREVDVPPPARRVEDIAVEGLHSRRVQFPLLRQVSCPTLKNRNCASWTKALPSLWRIRSRHRFRSSTHTA